MNVRTIVTCPHCASSIEVAVPRAAWKVQAEKREPDWRVDGYEVNCPDCGRSVFIHYWMEHPSAG